MKILPEMRNGNDFADDKKGLNVRAQVLQTLPKRGNFSLTDRRPRFEEGFQLRCCLAAEAGHGCDLFHRGQSNALDGTKFFEQRCFASFAAMLLRIRSRMLSEIILRRNEAL